MCNFSRLLTQLKASHKQLNAYMNIWNSACIRKQDSPMPTTVSGCSIMLYVQQKHKSTSIIISMHSGTLKLDFLRLHSWKRKCSPSTLTKRLDVEHLLILPEHSNLIKPFFSNNHISTNIMNYKQPFLIPQPNLNRLLQTYQPFMHSSIMFYSKTNTKAFITHLK
jgi:hypothetical protein